MYLKTALKCIVISLYFPFLADWTEQEVRNRQKEKET